MTLPLLQSESRQASGMGKPRRRRGRFGRLSGAGAEVLYVVLAVIVEELGVRRAKRITRPLLSRFIVAHSDAHHVVAGAEVLGVPVHMVGVVAERSLDPSRDIADSPV